MAPRTMYWMILLVNRSHGIPCATTVSCLIQLSWVWCAPHT